MFIDYREVKCYNEHHILAEAGENGVLGKDVFDWLMTLSVIGAQGKFLFE